VIKSPHEKTQDWLDQLLLESARAGNIPTAEEVLRDGANPDTPGLGASPLHYAAWNGDHRMIALLGSAGANPNRPDRDGSTPLFYAATRDMDRAARELIAIGANVNATNSQDMKAADFAGARTKALLVEEANIQDTMREVAAQTRKLGRRIPPAPRLRKKR